MGFGYGLSFEDARDENGDKVLNLINVTIEIKKLRPYERSQFFISVMQNFLFPYKHIRTRVFVVVNDEFITIKTETVRFRIFICK